MEFNDAISRIAPTATLQGPKKTRASMPNPWNSGWRSSRTHPARITARYRSLWQVGPSPRPLRAFRSDTFSYEERDVTVSTDELISCRQIRAARALIGWTQKDLGDAIGVHERQIRFWERRSICPMLFIIDKFIYQFVCHWISKFQKLILTKFLVS